MKGTLERMTWLDFILRTLSRETERHNVNSNSMWHGSNRRYEMSILPFHASIYVTLLVSQLSISFDRKEFWFPKFYKRVFVNNGHSTHITLLYIYFFSGEKFKIIHPEIYLGWINHCEWIRRAFLLIKEIRKRQICIEGTNNNGLKLKTQWTIQ